MPVMAPVTKGRNVFGFASDVLGDVDLTPDALSITLARATCYTNDVVTSPEEKRWQPAVDCGELALGSNRSGLRGPGQIRIVRLGAGGK